jgi:ATP-dependent DNA ligase
MPVDGGRRLRHDSHVAVVGAVGVEGLVAKNPVQRYLPGRCAWAKLRVRSSAEAIPAAVTGTHRDPSSVLLGRYDLEHRLRYTGRTTPLQPAAQAELGPLLTPAAADHPWTGRRFSAGWGTHDLLDVTLVHPQLVAGVSADVALDAAGRWRHPVRWLRLRPDMAPADVELFDTPPEA